MSGRIAMDKIAVYKEEIYNRAMEKRAFAPLVGLAARVGGSALLRGMAPRLAGALTRTAPKMVGAMSKAPSMGGSLMKGLSYAPIPSLGGGGGANKYDKIIGGMNP
jgi:hypothetical protein